MALKKEIRQIINEWNVSMKYNIYVCECVEVIFIIVLRQALNMFL